MLVAVAEFVSRAADFWPPAEIKVRLDAAKRWGGMTITPNNCPDVNTRYENFKAFFDACERHGRVE